MRLNPSTLPTDEPGPPAHNGAQPPRYDGERLTFGVHGALPSCCLRCGTENHVTHHKHIFLWLPPSVHLSLLCGVVPYVLFQNVLLLLCGVIPHFILKEFFLQRVEPVIPLCARCRSDVTTADLVRSLSPGVVLLVVCIFGMLDSADLLHLGHLWGLVGAATLFFIYRRFIAGKRLIVTRIHEGVISLKGILYGASHAMSP